MYNLSLKILIYNNMYNIMFAQFNYRPRYPESAVSRELLML